MTGKASGILAMIGACTIWGLSPLYYKLLNHLPPLEILAHRTMWSLVFFAGLLTLQGRLRLLAKALATPRMALTLGASGLMIGANWYLFIWAIHAERATEASLGYYIFPLVAVLLGWLFHNERLRMTQAIAVLIAASGVAVLTYGLGTAPWLALSLAITFGLYGLIKKGLDLGPVVSVTAEIAILTPLALLVLLQTHNSGQGAFGTSVRDTLLLICAGPLTATPLILFSLAARRLAMASVGVLQYINPTLQFACAVVVFAEPFSPWHKAAFALIWTAVALYSVSSLLAEKHARRTSIAASALGTSVT